MSKQKLQTDTTVAVKLPTHEILEEYRDFTRSKSHNEVIEGLIELVPKEKLARHLFNKTTEKK